jgi:biofilm PGA synthesis N-glycosyltransferase PgaC
MAQITLISWSILVPVLFYSLLMAYIAWHLSRIRQFKGKAGNKTEVSVVIACRNEEKNLAILLNDLAIQSYPSYRIEIIVVDDHSTDNTQNVLLSFRHLPRFTIVKNSGNGKKAAIRTGIGLSASNLILTTDADCRMGNNWISSIVSFYEEFRPDMIICPVVLQDKAGFFYGFQQLEFLSLQGVTAGTASAGKPVMCNGANLAFSREVYLGNVHRLREEIPSGDDIFLLDAMRKEKKKIMWLQSSDAVVTTGPATSLCSLFSQRARWISKAPAIRDLYTQVVSITTFITVIAILSLLITGLFVPGYLIILLAALIIKSIPDLIIVLKVCLFHKKGKLMVWFLPALLLYPFYGFITALISPFFKKAWK